VSDGLPPLSVPESHSKAMKTIGIVAKKNDPAALRAACEVHAWLAARGLDVLVARGSLPEGHPLGDVDVAELKARADLLVVLGGDGTLIYAAGLVAERQVPIFGVNLGTLGFLVEVELAEVYRLLEPVLAGHYRLEERMRLWVRLRRGPEELLSRHVVNDAVITKGALARIIDFEVTVDGHHLTKYNADGIIISTPTGSTAYNLAAGGPVLHPMVQGIIVTPICPHTLTLRPLVVPDQRTCRVRVLGPRGRVFLTLDGQEGHELQQDDVVEVSRSPFGLQIIRSPSRDFFAVLREKLKWGGR
jgi:NAD+ kinase